MLPERSAVRRDTPAVDEAEAGAAGTEGVCVGPAAGAYVIPDDDTDGGEFGAFAARASAVVRLVSAGCCCVRISLRVRSTRASNSASARLFAASSLSGRARTGDGDGRSIACGAARGVGDLVSAAAVCACGRLGAVASCGLPSGTTTWRDAPRTVAPPSLGCDVMESSRGPAAMPSGTMADHWPSSVAITLATSRPLARIVTL